MNEQILSSDLAKRRMADWLDRINFMLPNIYSTSFDNYF